MHRVLRGLYTILTAKPFCYKFRSTDAFTRRIPVTIGDRRALSSGVIFKMPEKRSQEKHDAGKGVKNGDHGGDASTAKSTKMDGNKGGEDGDTNSSNGSKEATDCAHHWEDHHARSGSKEYKKFKEQDRNDEAASEEGQSESESSRDDDDQEQPKPKKRGRGANQKGSNKKPKATGSSKEPQGTAGDKTRVPKVGQKVQWHSLPGYVDGEVVEVVYEEKTIEGKSVKASKEDPRIVLRSSSSGKIAVHKPEVVYFD